MDRIAAQAAFGQFLNDRSLAAAQIRFVEMVIDQLTARGIMDASALYDPPFSNLHNRGPDVLFVSKENVIDGSFGTLAEVHSELNVHEGQREQYGLPKYWTADGSPEFRCTLIGPDCWFVFCST
jgi:type I restriction enzyme R subunit